MTKISLKNSLASVSESSSGQSVQQSNSTKANASNTTLSSSAGDDQTDDKITNPSITTFGTLKYDVGNIDPGKWYQ